MKKILAFSVVALMFSLASCSKGSGSDEEELRPEVFIGNVTFYITKAPGCESLNVSIQTEDQTRTLYAHISKTNLTTTSPSCDMTTGFTFRNLPYGKYKYKASCGAREVNGTLTVSKECTTQSLD